MVTARKPRVARTKTAAASQDVNEEKLAQKIATQLERKIIALGWPVGRNLGKEASLVKRFGVSRWVVREAIAIAEFDGLLEVHRGRNGGLFVAQPAEDVIISAMRNYLLFSGVRIEEVLEARKMVESLTMRLAAERFSDEQVGEIRELIENWPTVSDQDALQYAVRVYARILDLADNRVLRIFGLVLSEVLGALGVLSDVPEFATQNVGPFVQELLDVRRRQVESIIAADPAAGVDQQQRLHELWQAMFRQAEQQRGVRRRRLAPSTARRILERIGRIYGTQSPRPVKKSSALMLQLQQTILTDHLNPGDPFAPEAQLMAQFGVGRGVLREAIRNLERHSFVAMGEGRHGGMRVAHPKPDATIRSAALFFKFLNVRRREVFEIAAEVELVAVELAARCARERGFATIKPLSEAIHARPSIVTPRLYSALAESSGNRIIELFLKTLLPLFTRPRTRTTTGSVRAQAQESVHLRLLELEKAVARGDASLARRSLIRARKEGSAIAAFPESANTLLGFVIGAARAE